MIHSTGNFEHRIKATNHPSLTFHGSSKASKKKYPVPLLFAAHTKVFKNSCKLATDAVDGPLLVYDVEPYTKRISLSIDFLTMIELLMANPSPQYTSVDD
jgi:hypothetical protein